MKLSKKLLSIALSVMLILGCLPVVPLISASALAAQNSAYLLSSGNSASVWSEANGVDNLPESVLAENQGLTFDGNYIKHTFAKTEAANLGIKLLSALDTSAFGGETTGIEAYAMLVDFSAVSVDTRWAYQLLDSNYENTNAFSHNNLDAMREAFLLSTENGYLDIINPATTDNGGFTIPAGFVGYFIVFTDGALGLSLDYSKGAYLQFERCDSAALGANLSKSFYTDSIFAVADINSFINSVAHAEYGVLAGSADYVVSIANNKASSYVQPHATSYSITVYDSSFNAVSSKTVTGPTCSFAGLYAGNKYYLQVIAQNGSEILAISKAQQFTATANTDSSDIAYLLNDCSDASTWQKLSQWNDGNKNVVVTNNHITADSSYMRLSFWSTLSWNTSVEWYIVLDNTVMGENTTGIKGYSMFLDHSELTEDFTWSFHLYDESVSVISGVQFSAVGQTALLINADTGEVSTVVGRSSSGGFEIPAGFRGYIVVLAEGENSDTLDYSTAKYLRIQRKNYSDNDLSGDLKHYYYGDSVYAIRDVDAFIEELMLGAYGNFAGTTDITPTVSVNNGVRFDWNAVSGAKGYQISIFDSNAKLIRTLDSAKNYIATSISSSGSYFVQVSAKGESGFIATSKLTAFNVTASSATAHKHKYAITGTTAATCVLPAVSTYTCSDCGHSYTANTGNAGGHNYKITTAASTCSKLGYTKYYCTVCHSTNLVKSTQYAAHTYTSKEVDPTCTEHGYTLEVCSLCGDTVKTVHDDELAHSYVSSTSDATCSTEGKISSICVYCGDKIDTPLETIGHTYSPWSVSGDTGIMTRTCTACGFTDSKHFSLSNNQLSVSGETTVAGDEVSVKVSLDVNNGFTTMRLALDYDRSVLELISVKDTGLIPGANHSDSTAANPFILFWSTPTAASEITATGEAAILTFKVSDTAKNGSYPVSVTYKSGDIIDYDLNDVSFLTNAGNINVKTPELSEYTYTVDSGVATITGYTGSDTALKLPAVIGEYPVKVIGKNAFYSNRNITEVVIPSSVTEIGENAFRGATALKSVTFGSSVEVIGKRAFNYTSLTEVKLPNTVTTIGDYAFAEVATLATLDMGAGVQTIGHYAFNNCALLKEITVPEPVEYIGRYAFYGCTSLKNFYYNSSVDAFCAGTEADPVFSPKLVFNAYLGDKVQMVPRSLFSGTYLVSIKWPNSNSLKNIEHHAFYMTRISSLDIPDSVEKIGDAAFRACVNLKSVNIGSNVKHIGKWAFYLCGSLDTVTFDGAPEYIGCWAFGLCNSLKELHLPEGVKSIDVSAIGDSANLEYMNIPTSVTYLGIRGIANGCDKLTLRTYYGTNHYEYCKEKGYAVESLGNYYAPESDFTYEVVDNKAVITGYTGNLITLLIPETLGGYAVDGIGAYTFFPGNVQNRTVKNVVVPKSLTFIDDNAFRGALRIENVVLTNNVISIGSRAFLNCTTLKNVTLSLDTVVASNAFEGCENVTFTYLDDEWSDWFE